MHFQLSAKTSRDKRALAARLLRSLISDLESMSNSEAAGSPGACAILAAKEGELGLIKSVLRKRRKGGPKKTLETVRKVARVEAVRKVARVEIVRKVARVKTVRKVAGVIGFKGSLSNSLPLG